MSYAGMVFVEDAVERSAMPEPRKQSARANTVLPAYVFEGNTVKRRHYFFNTEVQGM